MCVSSIESSNSMPIHVKAAYMPYMMNAAIQIVIEHTEATPHRGHTTEATDGQTPRRAPRHLHYIPVFGIILCLPSLTPCMLLRLLPISSLHAMIVALSLTLSHSLSLSLRGTLALAAASRYHPFGLPIVDHPLSARVVRSLSSPLWRLAMRSSRVPRSAHIGSELYLLRSKLYTSTQNGRA